MLRGINGTTVMVSSMDVTIFWMPMNIWTKLTAHSASNLPADAQDPVLSAFVIIFPPHPLAPYWHFIITNDEPGWKQHKSFVKKLKILILTALLLPDVSCIVFCAPLPLLFKFSPHLPLNCLLLQRFLHPLSTRAESRQLALFFGLSF